MRNSNNSKKIIFNTAKKLFWTKGYSNVSVRDIAKQSKYDIALISRYFGSKKKLFEETLKDAGTSEQEIATILESYGYNIVKNLSYNDWYFHI